MKILNIRDCLLSLSIISFPPEKKKTQNLSVLVRICQDWCEGSDMVPAGDLHVERAPNFNKMQTTSKYFEGEN